MNRLVCPLLTPYKDGEFDTDSMKRLLVATDKYVDIFVPCLSSGEGGELVGSAWEEVVSYVVENTNKPVFAGILNKVPETSNYLVRAKKIGCRGVVLPLGSYSKEEIQEVLSVAAKHNLKMIFYNTEENTVTDTDYVCEICSNETVYGFKDSSCDKVFLAKLIQEKTFDASWEIYQGMEMEISPDDAVDGYFIALANVEPEFCRSLVSNRDNIDWSKLGVFIEKYNLESPTWYLSLKEQLFNNSLFNSAETVS